MGGILEKVQILQTVEWLDKRIDETSKPIAMGVKDVTFDDGCKVYRVLKQRVLDAYPEVAEIAAALDVMQYKEGLRDKWLEKNGVE